MTTSYTGQMALICPDCGTHLVNLAPASERYHCPDCDLRLVRHRDAFLTVRYGEVVGQLPVEDVRAQVTWRLAAAAHVG